MKPLLNEGGHSNFLKEVILTLLAYAELSDIFQEESYQEGIGDHLLWYLCRKVHKCSKFSSADCYEDLENRVPFGSASTSWTPQDSTIYQNRYELIHSSNRAYKLACTKNPTVQNVEEFSSIKTRWSILYCVKAFLLDHPELAKQYRGMQPFGSKVISFMEKLGYDKISQTPTYKNHVDLMNLTNRLSDELGMTTVAINNMMYLEG